MSEYDCVKRGKLVLKGRPSGSKKRKLKKTETSSEPSEKQILKEDTEQHGGWWKVEKYEEMTGAICIEFGSGTYVQALDNGLFTVGAPHNEGEGPSPEEILTCFPTTTNKVALKSGYGKYLSVDKKGVVIGRSDAVGAMEQWEPVFHDYWPLPCNPTGLAGRVLDNYNAALAERVGEAFCVRDGKLALQGANECFLSVDSTEDNVVAQSKQAGAAEFLTVRSSVEVSKDASADVASEELGKLSEVEENYVRKFQKFQDKKVKICTEDRAGLQKAKDDGTLHEALLDRRSKMKADRYCK